MMTESAKSEHTMSSNDTTKPSVVDDFFSALFANNNKDNNDLKPLSSPIKPSLQEPILPARQPVSYDDVLSPKEELDEFDEYSLLSKKGHRQPQQQQERYLNNSSDVPAQILSKKEIDWSTVKPESRMLVRQFPRNATKHDVLQYFSRYGEVIEVVQKDSFGFVHFEEPSACARAVEAENGNILHGVTLDLEICKRKPYFARAKETTEDNLSDPTPSPPMARRNLKRRNSGTPANRSVRSRTLPQHELRRPKERYNVDNNHNSNSNSNSLSNPRKPTDNSSSTRLIPFRTGYAVPTVQIIGWGSTYHHFMTYVESVFQQYQVRTASAVIQYSAVNRSEIVKQLVLEGVKAIIMIDRNNLKKSRVHLQVFAPNGQGGSGVRYDEYDSITPLEAVNIIQRTYPIQPPSSSSNTSSSYRPPRQSYQHSSYQPQQHYQPHHLPPQQQQQQQQPPQQQPPQQQQAYVPSYQPATQYNQVPATSSPYTTANTPATTTQPIQLDTNTLSAIYSMIQPNPLPAANPYYPPVSQQAIVSSPQTASSTPPSQPTIPQLIATLMNGLNQSPSHIPSSPITVSPPQQQQQQPSIAALISTIANGNPGLLDSLTKTNPSMLPLLYQLSSGNSDTNNTSTSTPPPPTSL